MFEGHRLPAFPIVYLKAVLARLVLSPWLVRFGICYECSASKILRTLARQSAPSLRFASGDAGEGCQHVPISISSPLRASSALFSAYFPTPMTLVIPILVTTSFRWSSHALSNFLTAFPLILSGVIFFPVSPSNSKGQ